MFQRPELAWALAWAPGPWALSLHRRRHRRPHRSQQRERPRLVQGQPSSVSSPLRWGLSRDHHRPHSTRPRAIPPGDVDGLNRGEERPAGRTRSPLSLRHDIEPPRIVGTLAVRSCQWLERGRVGRGRAAGWVRARRRVRLPTAPRCYPEPTRRGQGAEAVLRGWVPVVGFFDFGRGGGSRMPWRGTHGGGALD